MSTPMFHSGRHLKLGRQESRRPAWLLPYQVAFCRIGTQPLLVPLFAVVVWLRPGSRLQLFSIGSSENARSRPAISFVSDLKRLAKVNFCSMKHFLSYDWAALVIIVQRRASLMGGSRRSLSPRDSPTDL